jgi:hypothetical protein
MSVNLVQNFYKQTITTPWAMGLGNFYVSQKPNVSVGFLVISPNSESLREIVEYSAVGTDGGGDYVTVSARGLGGTIEQTHAAQEKVYMNITAEHIQQIKESIEAISAAGALDASTTVKGVARLTANSNLTIGTVTMTIASPAVATFVGHGLTVNDQIQFTTTGALPTGVSPSVTYFVISAGLTADNFRFSATFGGAAINTSGSQSGTHTLTRVTPRAVSPNDPVLPSQAQKNAMAGGGSFGTPDTGNKFATEAFINALPTPQIVVFTASGTWTKDAGLKYIIVEGVGAGAQSSGTGSGGGGGYFKKLILAASLGATETVTIGATGNPGGSTTFGAHATGNGGGFGGVRKTGGTATGGDLNIQGGDGIDSGSGGTGGNYGVGGQSQLGHATDQDGTPRGYGAGSAGENGAGVVNGTNGIIIVTEYY